MFLSKLTYQEKRMFLDLSIHVAKANDVLGEEEKALISAYCAEMQLPPIELYEAEPLETITSFFALADEYVKKIILLEIFGLVYVDGNFDNDETSMVKKFADEIGISKEVYNNIHNAIKDYYRVCKELTDIVT